MAHKTLFHSVPERPDFPAEELKILDYWNKIDAFNQQLKLTQHHPRFTFYDGPPFATGLPHYGHMCAGTIKDVICRYFSQNGRHVERRFGWDCHGLPVEYEIDKLLQIKHRGEVLEMGIAKYNEHCRSIVQKYSKAWRRIIGRIGRWIDFDNDYKTLDTSFMESVWWVFKQLWEKGLVYRGCRVMPYSNGCSTVLSNFETQQNYKEVLDPAIVVNFPLLTDPETAFVAWTTTPWTLPSNLGLAVHPKLDYVKLKDKASGAKYILAKARIVELYPKGQNYEILEEFKGETLVGLEYKPLFDYFLERRNQGCFKVIAGDFVTSSDGTGIVHMAPGFGEDDYKACLKAGIVSQADPLVPVDASGNFTEGVTDYKGMLVTAKETNSKIRQYLKQINRLVKDDQTKHNYPFCWRSETPLIYKAVNCWFIKVTQIKEQLVANNKKARWVPENIQVGRFHNWLEEAKDWCFSRNRFWGNPIPLWVSDDFEEVVCVGSIQELKELSGVQDIQDLHREHIDHITIPSKQGKGVLRRIEEVFDCWFESGAMPFAQQHYPFENKEIFEKIFPADFIAEGLDQTRGWFYTLNVLATAIRNDTPYFNLIVNGIVLNEHGEKMSKKKKNYPDPEEEVINVFGADAMRMYLINSGLVKAQDLHFSVAGVKSVIRDVFLPWYNAYRFLVQNISRFEAETGQSYKHDLGNFQRTNNVMDKWIVSSIQSLVQYVRQEMESYRLYTVVPRLVSFLEQLTNWYLRLNRLRLKGDHGGEDWIVSLTVLFEVLHKINILLSPIVPFITESFYQNLRKAIQGQTPDSIHFIDIPNVQPEFIDVKIEQQVQRMQDLVERARKLREQNKISLKQPVQSLTIVSTDAELIQATNLLRKYIEEEINTPNVVVEEDIAPYLQYKAEPNNAILGKELKEKFGPDLIQKIRSLSQEQILTLKADSPLKLNVIVKKEKPVLEQKEEQAEEGDQKGKNKKKGKQKVEYEEIQTDCEIYLRHVTITDTFNVQKLDKMIFTREQGFTIIIDPSQDQKLRNQGFAREFTNRIQKLRKTAGLQQDDQVIIFYEFEKESEVSLAVAEELASIQQTIKKPLLKLAESHKCLKRVTTQECEIEGHKVNLVITKLGRLFRKERLLAKFNEKEVDVIQQTVFLLPPSDNYSFHLDGKLIELGPEEVFLPK